MRQRLIFGLVALGMVLSASAVFAQSECTADIRGKLMRKEEGDIDTKLTAKIDVSANQSCAVVHFELIVVEELTGGETFEVRVPKRAKIRDATTVTMKLNYKLKKGRTIANDPAHQTGAVY